jgi:hypothetical protein
VVAPHQLNTFSDMSTLLESTPKPPGKHATTTSSEVSAVLPVATGLLFFAWECCRYLYLFRYADDSKLTAWLPDDAFYFLILGRNFTLLHRWTFDGAAPATGFHLLWGYMIALIYWIASIFPCSRSSRFSTFPSHFYSRQRWRLPAL